MLIVVTLDRQRTAVIIIDMQNDFLDHQGYFGRTGWPVDNLRRAIAPLVRLRAGLPAATRVVYTEQNYEPDGSDELTRHHRLGPFGRRSGGAFPTPRGSWGAAVVPELQPRAGDVVIRKRRFDAFYGTELEMLLRHWGVDTLVVTGVVADICVGFTIRSAFIRDFDVILARECVAGWDPECEAEIEHAVSRHLGVVLSVDEILQALRG